MTALALAPLRETWRADRRLTAGLVVLGGAVVLAVLAPLLSSPDPGLSDVAARRFAPPFGRTPDGVLHLLGTDRFGRDLLGRLLHGSRISLTAGVLAALVATMLGTTVGAVAGYAGGWTDRLLTALTDAALAVPRVPLLLLLAALWEPGLVETVVAIGVTGWMTVARLVRAEVRAARVRGYVEAARALGARPVRVVARHILPHAMGPALVATALGVGQAILLEAGLSFLGLGVQPPAASWGNLIAAGRDSLVVAPWVALVPAAAVALVVLACSLVGDALESTLARDTAASGSAPS